MPSVKPTTMERRSSARVAANPYLQHHLSSSSSSPSSSTPTVTSPTTCPSSSSTTQYINLPIGTVATEIVDNITSTSVAPITCAGTTTTVAALSTACPSISSPDSSCDANDGGAYQGNGHSGNASVTYAALIALAIELSDDKRLVLDDIYKFVEKHRSLVPVKSHPNWKNSVRHNLSLRPCFVKVPRFNSSGKAMSAWWTLDVSCLPKAAKEAVERARRFTEGSTQTQTTDQFIREVLTTEDHPCTMTTTSGTTTTTNMHHTTTSYSPVSAVSSPSSSSSHSESQDYMTTDSVPDMYTTEVTPTPPYTLSSTNSFLFADNGAYACATEEEFATVPGNNLSPPHLYFPDPEESPFPDFQQQMAVYPNDFDAKYARENGLFDLTLPSPFSKSSFAFSDLLFSS